ncbi:UDP-glucose 4-epimerase GalE [Desmospora activa]|uniref:UDP-glucose 4-epimerase n=1 Tax=Desmospora activa DSM 45169 TaxID=1121389 RepID=A0A2T4ZB75_9BACL|nr:UDP-glucose 4-epimerase GalE [Desmospora activa]PTM59153.1 UDP-glucose 4-epimerase [Desmospora activa DSM 45169]
MAILVTGGAGYIGSHTVRWLQEAGEEVVVLDHLRTGHRKAVQHSPLIEGDIRDREELDRLFQTYSIEAVIHFAASSLVGESTQRPLDYYDNNINGTRTLLAAMADHGVDRIVFSSTAAVYGEPKRVPILETDSTAPASPYGETKWAIEHMLGWAEQAHGIRFVCLRYFNAAGAWDRDLGEDHDPETHLVPLVLKTALGQRETITVFGDDYPTPDGTCIRDYVHVKDLAHAHALALKRLREGGASGIYNLGSGTGFSVRQVIEEAERVTGRTITVTSGPRRAGDPAVLIASHERARQELGWEPTHTRLETIISSAWEWHYHHPDGFADEKGGGK